VIRTTTLLSSGISSDKPRYHLSVNPCTDAWAMDGNGRQCVRSWES